MPRDLALQVETLSRGGRRYASPDPGDPGLVILARTPEPHPQASGLLALVEARCRPPGLDVVSAWLGRLTLGLPNAPTDRGGLSARIEMLAETCADLPAGVFCQETLIEARRTFTFWPTNAEMYKLLRPHADRLIGTRDALRRIAAAADQPAPEPAQPPRQAPDEGVQDQVREMVQAFLRERSWANQDGLPPANAQPAPRALTLSDAQLLAFYEKQAIDGVPCAATRVAMLRKRLSLPTPAPNPES